MYSVSVNFWIVSVKQKSKTLHGTLLCKTSKNQMLCLKLPGGPKPPSVVGHLLCVSEKPWVPHQTEEHLCTVPPLLAH